MSSWGFDFNPFGFYLNSSLCYYKYSFYYCEKIFSLFCKKQGFDRTLFHCSEGFLCYWLNTEHTVIYIFILA